MRRPTLRVLRRSPRLTPVAQVEEDLCIHILSVSAVQVGVCLTVIGVVNIVASENINRFVDDLLAGDAFLFTVSCALSYAALRVRRWRRMRHLERFAEMIFVLGLLVMVAICAAIVYEVV